MSAIKSQLVSIFKMHGYTLKGEASRYLVEVFTPVDERDREKYIDKLVEAVQKQQLTSTSISRDICEAAVNECNAEVEEHSEEIFSVIDAFSVPKYAYNYEKKKWLQSTDAISLHPSADAKCDLFRGRYDLLYQRTQRHPLFRPPALGEHAKNQMKHYKLRSLEVLLSSHGGLNDVIILGMLTQRKGQWHLEDPTGAVQLDLANAKFIKGLFTENCFILAEGDFDDGVFSVKTFGFPPAEPAANTRDFFGSINFFGGPGSVAAKCNDRLQLLEQNHSDAMMVFVSDVWLDNAKVLERLALLFTGFSEAPPTCFVFCGHFLSQPYGARQAKKLRDCFQRLGMMLAEHKTLIEGSKFIFVPSTVDPGPSKIIPRPAIPDSITEPLRRKVPNCIFTSNPCRIQFCTKEVVVYREDILMKMCRYCVRFPTDADVTTNFARTLVHQGHLCPLPPQVAPVYWSYDHALRLYPLPDLVMVADSYDPFESEHEGCQVVNPGSFPKNDFAFQVYYPANNSCERSKVTIP